MKRAWAVAFRNLRRSRRRNLATAAAIAFGYAGLVVLGGYGARVNHFLQANSVYLQHTAHVAAWMEGGLERAGAEPEKFQLDAQAQQALLTFAKNDARVEFSGRYLRGMGLAGNGCATHPARLLGVEPEVLGRVLAHPYVQTWTPELSQPQKGRWLHEIPAVANAAAVSSGLAVMLKKPRVLDELKGLPPAPIVLDCDTPKEDEQLALDANVQVISMTYDGMMNAVDTEMAATFNPPEASMENGVIQSSLQTLQTLFATDRVTYVGFYLHNPDDAPAFAADLTRAMNAAGLKIEAPTFNDERWNPYYVGTMAFLKSMLSVVTLLVSLVLILTVIGALTLSILERTREIGTWRALGFGRGTLTALVVREAFLLAVFGLLLGLVVGLGAAATINASGFRFSPPGVSGTILLLIKPSALACAVQAAFILPGVCIAAWFIARAQVRRNVVELLTAQSG